MRKAKTAKHYAILDPVVRTKEDALEVTTPDPEPVAVAVKAPPEPQAQEPEYHFWPKGKALPGRIRKVRRQPQPCPECRRVYLPTGGQATVCMSSGKDVAWFRCLDCGHRWALGVQAVD